ncbi:hypothetical protein FF1_043611 [Malus domestica]
MHVTSDVPSVSPSVGEDASQKDYMSTSQYRPHCSSHVNPKTINSTHLAFESRCPVVINNDCSTMKFTVAFENVPPSGYDHLFPREKPATSNFPKYPLCYGNLPQFEELKAGFVVHSKLVSNLLKPAKMGVIPNLLYNGDKANNNTRTHTRDYPESPYMIGCDLSLRLGPLSSQCQSSENSQAQEGKKVGVQEGTKCSDQSLRFDKQFPLIPEGNEYGPINSWSRLSFESEDKYMQVVEPKIISKILKATREFLLKKDNIALKNEQAHQIFPRTAHTLEDLSS